MASLNNETPTASAEPKPEGSEYLVPKPEPRVNGYAVTYGLPVCATAIASPSGVKPIERE